MAAASAVEEGPAAPTRSILSLRSIARSASRLAVAGVLTTIIGVPTNFLVARWLGPDRYGNAQFVLLAYFFASLVRTGTFEGGIRAYLHHRSRGDEASAALARDVAVTFETVASIVPGLVMVAVAAFLGDPLRRTGFFLAPLAVVAASLASYIGGVLGAQQRFDVVARGNLLRGVIAAVVALIGVPTIGAVALFVAPAVADAVTVGFLVTRRPGLHLAARFDRRVWVSIVRPGVSLGAMGIVYWAYRMVGSTAVALSAGASVYGLYAFAAAPVAILARAVASIHAALTPAVWSELAHDQLRSELHHELVRVSLLLAVVAGVAANLAQAGFGPVVDALLPRYRGSVPIFDVLACNIVLLSIGAVPALVLNSVRVGRQASQLTLWLGALAVNVAVDVVAVAMGAGVLAIAWNDIWVQACLLVATWLMARRHLGDGSTRRRALLLVLPTVALAGLVGLLLHLWPISAGPSGAWATALAARVLLVAMAWGLAVSALAKCGVVSFQPRPA